MPIRLWTARGCFCAGTAQGELLQTLRPAKSEISTLWPLAGEVCPPRCEGIHGEPWLNATDHILSWVSCFKDKPTRSLFAGIHQQPTAHLETFYVYTYIERPLANSVRTFGPSAFK